MSYIRLNPYKGPIRRLRKADTRERSSFPSRFADHAAPFRRTGQQTWPNSVIDFLARISHNEKSLEAKARRKREEAKP